METYYTLGKALVVLVLVIQCAGLAVLIWALLKHRRSCFALLIFAAVTSLVYSILAGTPFFVHVSLQTHILLARVLLVLAAATGIIGLWGWVALVRSYRAAA